MKRLTREKFNRIFSYYPDAVRDSLWEWTENNYKEKEKTKIVTISLAAFNILKEKAGKRDIREALEEAIEKYKNDSD